MRPRRTRSPQRRWRVRTGQWPVRPAGRGARARPLPDGGVENLPEVRPRPGRGGRAAKPLLCPRQVTPLGADQPQVEADHSVSGIDREGGAVTSLSASQVAFLQQHIGQIDVAIDRIRVLSAQFDHPASARLGLRPVPQSPPGEREQGVRQWAIRPQSSRHPRPGEHLLEPVITRPPEALRDPVGQGVIVRVGPPGGLHQAHPSSNGTIR